jgi:hypothetical protein
MLPGSSYHAGNVDLTFPARRACLVKRTEITAAVQNGLVRDDRRKPRAITALVLV